MGTIMFKNNQYGSDTDYVELTQAEYDLLTPAEKTNGTLYFITDGSSGGDDTNAYHINDTAETTLSDTDSLPFFDVSADAARKILLSNFKAELKAYFDQYYEKKPKGWAEATDAEIASLLSKHYAGKIDLYETEGWEIGAERTITLSAMNATEGYVAAQPAQTVTLVLMDKGADKVFASDNNTLCAFVVGQKNCLQTNTYIDHPENVLGWEKSKTRIWLNNQYYNAFPSSYKNLMKQFKNKIIDYADSKTNTTINDYCSLPAQIEIFNTKPSNYADEGRQFEYYINASNRIKDKDYWTRSMEIIGPGAIYYRYFKNNTGEIQPVLSPWEYGIAPFHCI